MNTEEISSGEVEEKCIQHIENKQKWQKEILPS
jgi:hypothetical protein